MREKTDMRPAASGTLLAGPSDGSRGPQALTGDTAARSPWEIAWRRFKRHKLAMIGAIVLLILVVGALAAPIIAHHDYAKSDITNSLKGPSSGHPFGTDNIGRDQFSRVIYGGRISLLIGVSVALMAGILGTVIGAIAGYYGRWVDQILMRVTDLFLAIPLLVILIISVRLLSGTIFDIVLILSLVFWMPNARIVRGVVLSLKEKEFVEASRSLGSSNMRIVFSEILPNVIGPIIVILTLNVAQAIITESALSFLGFGVQPPTPTWGNLLANARNFQLIAPSMVWFPGLFILITVLAVNLMGDGLRDALDPHQALRSEG
jgi:peptide/nickel transport system permease protein